MGGITTHVLDTARGRPAAGVLVTLEMREGKGRWTVIDRGATDSDGRLKTLMADTELQAGTYRLTFHTDVYFRQNGNEAFFPEVSIVFEVHDALQHYHVPLLLSPYGYTTYRGS
jgi:5-hydroxyisourate hydrolase